MEKYRKVELKDILYIKNGLDVDKSNYEMFKEIYYDYLNEKNIQIVYNGQDFLKYIDKVMKKLEEPKKEMKIKKEKPKYEEDGLKHFKKALLRIGLFLFLYSGHVVYKDYNTHEKVNIKNAYMILTELAKDTNNDNVLEIDTRILKYIEEYFEPTEVTYYRVTNKAYNLLDKVRIIDNISMMEALDIISERVIEIDKEIYSKTGEITILSYLDEDDCIHSYKLDGTFEDNSKACMYLLRKLRNEYGEDCGIHGVQYIGKEKTKKFEELPTIIRSKKTGDIKIKEPNKILTKIFKNND